MGILSRPKLVSQIRLDLEDVNTLLAALRTDSKLWTREFLSDQNYILKGFSVSGIGLKSATIEMDNATLIHAENSTDFSWFTAEDSPSDITIADADLVDNSRNYIELKLSTVDGTPLVKAFWDPSANAGAGGEFNQSVNTVTDLQVEAVVLSGGFSGSADRLPLAIIDTDASGNIAIILDQRELFFRMGTPADPSDEFSWGSQEEPVYTAVLSGGSGTYTAGETITFDGAETATVVTGGTTNITFKLPSAITFSESDTVVGSDSGASRTLVSVIESFTGADKDISNMKDALKAIQTEIKRVKGTDFWYQVGVGSISGVSDFLNSAITPITSGAKISWDGSALSFTDDSGAPADADVVARVRMWTKSATFDLTRQDGTGGSSTISIADGEVLFVEIPAAGNRTFSGAGAGTTNFQTVALGSFVANDQNYWLAFREGSKLIFRGAGELQSGESAEISDNVPTTLLNNIGLTDEASAPSYSSDIRGTSGESLVARIGALTSNQGDYQEDRSAYLRSDSAVTWTGTQLEFTTDIVLELLNTKTGTITTHVVDLSDSPLALADGESLYFNIDRTSNEDPITLVNSGVTPIPAQTQANKDVFVFFRRVDALGVGYLHIPLHKQVLEPGQTVRLGASGSGSGGANSILETLKNRLADSTFNLLTPNIFSLDGEDEIDSATADFNVADNTYDFDAAENIISIDSLDPTEFMTNDLFLDRVELAMFWKEGSVDTGATYQVSRNGGTDYQTVTMERVGSTTEYRGIHTFTEETTQTLVDNGIGSPTGEVELSDTSGEFFAQKFTVASGDKIELRDIQFAYVKTGSAVGKLYVSIRQDDSGDAGLNPDDVLAQTVFDIGDDFSGTDIDIADFGDIVLPAGDYHIVFETDQEYKDNFTTGVDVLEIRVQSAASPDGRVYNGSTWSDTGTGAFAHRLRGIEYDLRVKVTASATASLEAYGIFYEEQLGSLPVAADKPIQKFQFNSVTDNDNTFSLSFTPDPDLLRCYYVEAGQVFKLGAFEVSGTDVIFPANTFDNGGVSATVTLIFDQTNGGAFDNSDTNAANISTNSTQINITQLRPGAYNMGMNLSGGLFKLTRADGVAFSAANHGLVAMQSNANPGQTVLLKATGTYQFEDVNGTSDVTGMICGVTGNRAWDEDRPVYLYAVNSDDTDSGLEFAWSFRPNATRSPSTAAEIGYHGNPSTNDADSDFFFMTATNVTSSHANKPCILIGGFRFQKPTTAEEWAVQVIDTSKGDGIRPDPFVDAVFKFPLGQMGADAGNLFTAASGSGPVWTTPANIQAYYKMGLDGHCDYWGSTNNAGVVATTGHASDMRVFMPYAFFNYGLATLHILGNCPAVCTSSALYIASAAGGDTKFEMTNSFAENGLDADQFVSTNDHDLGWNLRFNAFGDVN